MRKITENRNPFGVLNLSKLIIKDLAHTWIILDSANNTIKVTRDSDWSWQIRVYEICDENGENCSSAAAIYNTITNWAWAWNGISAGWETWEYCFLNEENLKCSNDALKIFVMELIEWTPWGTRQPNLVDQDGYVTAPTADKKNMVRKTNEQWVPGWREDATWWWDWTRQPNTKDQAGYVATWNWNANMVRKTDGSWNPGWREDATWGWDWVTYTAWTNITISDGVISATNTWKENKRGQEGYVLAPNWLTNKCRRTNAFGNPEWWSCWWWSSEWTTKELTSGSNTTTFLYPQSNTYNVNIWRIPSVRDKYKLYVNWETKFSGKVNIGDYLFITWSAQRPQYIPGRCNQNYAYSPLITYTNNLVIRQQTWLSCANDYTMFGANWNVWIGWESNEWNIKLSVYGHTRIYSTASDTDQFIDLYTENYWASHIESKRREMKIWLSWTYEWWWNPSYIYFRYWAVWINKTPDRTTTETPWRATLQIAWWIQISSNGTPSNVAWNSYNCDGFTEWTIQYYSWNFFGCVKYSSNSYWRRVFDTSQYGNTMPSTPILKDL